MHSPWESRLRKRKTPFQKLTSTIELKDFVPLKETPVLKKFKGHLDLNKGHVLFHGTSTVNAKNIIKEGWDPKKRQAQALGPGEYFTSNLCLAECYSQGKILVAYIPKEKAKCVAAGVYVVNNPTHTTYCLPIGSIETH